MQKEDDLPVYEAEIIERSATAADEACQIVPAKPQNLVKRSMAYRIGKTVGSLAVLTGLYREIRAIVRGGQPGEIGQGRGQGMGMGQGRGNGKGMGKGKGRKRNRKMRRII